jgi:hypothetical protein
MALIRVPFRRGRLAFAGGVGVAHTSEYQPQILPIPYRAANSAIVQLRVC